jgi:hypothetical protein
MKFEFIKELRPNGNAMYYTRMNGNYVSDSVSFDEAKAKELYDFFVAHRTIKSVEVVIESVEVEDEKAK